MAGDVTTGRVAGPPAERRRVAWIVAGLGLWICGGFTLFLWALSRQLTYDAAASVFHIPIYLGLGAGILWLGGRMVRAVRGGHGWRDGIPAGYGFLAAGIAALIATMVIDLGWRQGVGFIQGNLENDLGPSRILFAVALVLVAGAPLRAAQILPPASVPLAAQLLSASLVLGVLAWPGTFHPATDPWLERAPILAGEDGELWRMNADGTHQERLVPSDGSIGIGYASWSPSGSRIAYTVIVVPNGDFSKARAEVWVADADGGSPHRLTSGDDMRWIPRWSPDEAEIVFTVEAIGGPWGKGGPEGPGQGEPQGVTGPLSFPLPNADIFRMPTTGGEPRRLTDGPGDNRAPVYSPDGSRLLFDSTRDGNTEIYVMDADGSHQQRLTDDPAEDWGASWSPDGSRIAFNSFRTGNFEIYVMDADGGSVRQVTHDGARNTAPSWSPDGRMLSYTRSTSGTDQVWSVDLESGNQRNLSQLAAARDFAWTGAWGRGGTIVFSRYVLVPAHTALAHDNLGTAAMLISAMLLAAVLVLVGRREHPFGSYAVVVMLGTTLAAIPAEGWRFLPVGLAVGLVVDVAAWLSPTALRARTIGAVGGAAFVLASGGLIALTSTLAWTPSLLLGIAAAAGAIGWAIGAIGQGASGAGDVAPG
jgi:hypothetical protein